MTRNGAYARKDVGTFGKSEWFAKILDCNYVIPRLLAAKFRVLGLE